jgi:cell division protein ZapE
MTLKTLYAKTLAEHGFDSDSMQLEAIEHLDRIQRELCERAPAARWLTQLKRRLPGDLGQQTPVQGLYMWGGVGRGKTFVMDVFFESLPFDDKLRFHFHRLMYRVHKHLAELEGQVDPIEIVADDLAKQARVICFDEFFVNDIGDAMLLSKLLSALFNRGVCLITTSNIKPQDLYAGGLQRQQFIPAIELICTHTKTFNLDGINDYRLRVLEQAELWHTPSGNNAQNNLDKFFTAVAPDTGTKKTSIEILGRDIPVSRRADGVAWFEFSDLCDGPRSQDDYIEIARAFQTVLVSNVPRLDREQDNQARRFIALIDEFYDRKVKLCASAAAPIADIYQGKRLKPEFERTISRLLEMQSTAYLAAGHIG